MHPLRTASSLTFLLAITAVILSLLCLFSGATTKFVADGRLITINLSQLGQTNIIKENGACNPQSQPQSQRHTKHYSKHRAQLSTQRRSINALENISHQLETGAMDVQSAGDKLGDELNKEDPSGCTAVQANNAIHQAAKQMAASLNLPQFVDVHVLNLCFGSFSPSDYATTGAKPRRKVQSCTRDSNNFIFNPGVALAQTLPAGTTLQSIGWPQQISEAAHTLQVAFKLMLVFYATAAGLTALGAIMSIWGMCAGSRASGAVSFMLILLGFVALLISSGASTAIILKGTQIINQSGGPIGLTAQKGKLFLALTWSATAALFISMLAICFGSCCVGSYERRHYGVALRQKEMEETVPRA